MISTIFPDSIRRILWLLPPSRKNLFPAEDCKVMLLSMVMVEVSVMSVINSTVSPSETKSLSTSLRFAWVATCQSVAFASGSPP